MKHKNKVKPLGRKKAARCSMFRNLSSSLIREQYVVTTETKGKELRRYFEPLVTAAKGELTLTKRRKLISKLAHKEDVAALVEIASENEKRPGGYLRLIKLPPTIGDNSPTVKVELVK
jgi:large subunit ribosomal protein L17